MVEHYSIGALGDTFYDYLLKSYIQSNGNDTQALEMIQSTISSVLVNLIHFSPETFLTYTSEMFANKHVNEKMDHMSCFAGNLFT